MAIDIPSGSQENKVIEGVIVKDVTRYPDERGFFSEIIRSSECGFHIHQVSHAVKMGMATGWHICRELWETYYVARGVIRVVLKDCRNGKYVKTNFMYQGKELSVDYGLSGTPDEYTEIVLGEYSPKSIVIPPGVAHGYKVLSGECDMIYIASKTYSEYRPDEGRIEPSRWPEHDWTREIEVK